MLNSLFLFWIQRQYRRKKTSHIRISTNILNAGAFAHVLWYQLGRAVTFDFKKSCQETLWYHQGGPQRHLHVKPLANIPFLTCGIVHYISIKFESSTWAMNELCKSNKQHQTSTSSASMLNQEPTKSLLKTHHWRWLACHEALETTFGFGDGFWILRKRGYLMTWVWHETRWICHASSL